MKLLSIRKDDGRNRAGVAIGNDVLDIAALQEMRRQDELQIPLIEGALRDAIDLFTAGPDRVKSIASAVETDAEFADRCREAGVLVPLSSVALDSPVLSPGKILAIGLNYRAHAAEQNVPLPESPLVFSKCTTALNHPGGAILLPRISNSVDYEGELAVVIGKRARSIRASEAFEHICGYTIMNDVTARDLQKREKQWARAKGLDSFAPCGPWVVTPDEITDPHTLGITLRVNGEIRQNSNTGDLIFKIPELVEFVSQDLTLEPGDIISTGTPSGVGAHRKPPVFLQHGDEIEIEIERIGILKNAVEGA